MIAAETRCGNAALSCVPRFGATADLAQGGREVPFRVGFSITAGTASRTPRRRLSGNHRALRLNNATEFPSRQPGSTPSSA